MKTSETEHNISRTVKWREQQQHISLLDFEIKQPEMVTKLQFHKTRRPRKTAPGQKSDLYRIYFGMNSTMQKKKKAFKNLQICFGCKVQKPLTVFCNSHFSLSLLSNARIFRCLCLATHDPNLSETVARWLWHHVCDFDMTNAPIFELRVTSLNSIIPSFFT